MPRRTTYPHILTSNVSAPLAVRVRLAAKANGLTGVLRAVRLEARDLRFVERAIS
jgi:hypothetical protein